MAKKYVPCKLCGYDKAVLADEGGRQHHRVQCPKKKGCGQRYRP